MVTKRWRADRDASLVPVAFIFIPLIVWFPSGTRYRPPPEHHDIPTMPTESTTPNRLSRLLNAFAGLVYPDLCLGCDRRLPIVDGVRPSIPVCDACLAKIPPASKEDIAAAALLTAPEAGIGHATALWRFHGGGVVQRLQHALKYGGRTAMGKALGRKIGERLVQLDLEHPDVVTPVPLHRTRQLERGFNQSELLARGIAEVLDIEMNPGLLARTKATRSQTELNDYQRRQNVAGAFSLVEGLSLEGKCILLVDDIATTGSTSASAAKTLTDAGAIVDAAFLAVAI